MFGMQRRGSNAYATVGLETGVVDASPLKLTVMLYEGAITACIQAQQALAAQDYNKKGACLIQAMNIIDNGLRASLNKGNGGDIAQNLDALYQYMSMTLMQANIHKDGAKIDEVQHLLMDIKSAWESLEKSPTPAAGNQEAMQHMIQQRTQQLQQTGRVANLAAAGA